MGVSFNVITRDMKKLGLDTIPSEVSTHSAVTAQALSQVILELFRTIELFDKTRLLVSERSPECSVFLRYMK